MRGISTARRVFTYTKDLVWNASRRAKAWWIGVTDQWNVGSNETCVVRFVLPAERLKEEAARLLIEEIGRARATQVEPDFGLSYGRAASLKAEMVALVARDAHAIPVYSAEAMMIANLMSVRDADHSFSEHRAIRARRNESSRFRRRRAVLSVIADRYPSLKNSDWFSVTMEWERSQDKSFGQGRKILERLEDDFLKGLDKDVRGYNRLLDEFDRLWGYWGEIEREVMTGQEGLHAAAELDRLYRTNISIERV